MKGLVDSKFNYWRSHQDDVFQQEMFPVKTKFFSMANVNRLVSSIFENTGKVVSKAEVYDTVSRVYENNTHIKKSESNIARAFIGNKGRSTNNFNNSISTLNQSVLSHFMPNTEDERIFREHFQEDIKGFLGDKKLFGQSKPQYLTDADPFERSIYSRLSAKDVGRYVMLREN